MLRKKGQIWVETVVYTLIGLALIGLALAFISPKISESKDRAVIEQTIDSLGIFDDKINEVTSHGPGNRRYIDFTMRRGELHINSKDDKITVEIGDISKPFTEPGVDVPFGRVTLRSEKGQKTSTVNLTLDYKDRADLTYRLENVNRKFSPASAPYRFSIENVGLKVSIRETKE